MRLNFSGVDEDAIREGIRRLGEVVREQVDLYGTLIGVAPAGGARPRAEAAPMPARAPAEESVAAEAELAKVLHLRSRAR
jgi:2-aminoadipate transaminase